MKKIIIILCAALFFIACKKHNTKKVVEEKTVEKETPAAESNLIEITEAQMKAVGITTDTLEYKDLTATVKVNGVLAVPNQNKALVTSVTNGVIKTLNVSARLFKSLSLITFEFLILYLINISSDNSLLVNQSNRLLQRTRPLYNSI